MTASLTTTDAGRLAACEARIQQGLTTFIEVGQALMEIRDQRLYRATHGRFEDYCRERWGMDRINAHRHIEAATKVLSFDNTDLPRPSSLGVARELPREPEQAREVWAQAVEQHGPTPTAAQVRDVRAESTALTVVEPDPTPDLPDGIYRTIVADPPWRYGNTATRGSAENHYPTMSMDELLALDVPAVSAADAHLYLWVTNGFLREGFDLIAAWGFTYKACLTWVKPQMGLGNYFRGATEHVLFGVRGRLPTNTRAAVNWFQAPRGRHSAKPEAFYDLVEDASPGPYLEMFARRQRLGWSTWGNEAIPHADLVEVVA